MKTIMKKITKECNGCGKSNNTNTPYCIKCFNQKIHPNGKGRMTTEKQRKILGI